MSDDRSLRGLADDLASGRTSAFTLTEECLGRIDEAGGQGTTAFVAVDRQAALATAKAMDALRAAGTEPSRFAGIPISIKDLFDVRGQVTRAGSRVLDGPAASQDAPAVARLRAAGFVLIGRTNMTEFAFSGLGLNPHYGTPRSPWRRDEGRISGGSTSGGAVSVADGMAHAALGTDTGGSCRIPAAWCGLVGFKPTADRVSKWGAVPLSPTLDSVGPIARSVDCCAIIDSIVADTPLAEPAAREVRNARLLLPTNFMLDGLAEEVARTFEQSVAKLRQAGASIDERSVPELDRIAAINTKGGYAAAESWAWHRRLIEASGDLYDPRVMVRIRRGAELDSADFLEVVAARGRLVADIEARLAGYDAMIMPTTPILPPRLDELADDAEYGRINLLALRNPTAVNMFDGCAISLPAAPPGEPPVGLMLAALRNRDAELFALARAVEAVLG